MATAAAASPSSSPLLSRRHRLSSAFRASASRFRSPRCVLGAEQLRVVEEGKRMGWGEPKAATWPPKAPAQEARLGAQPQEARDSRMKIFSGTANRPLAQEIASYLGVDLGKILIKRFADGEIYVQLQESVRGCDVFLVQPTCSPVNENLMELFIMIDACRRASARSITVVIPYFGYARADRKAQGREAITAKLAANLLTEAGSDRVILCDIHSAQALGYFDIPVDHIYGQPVILDYLASKTISKDLVVVSPDVGGVVRARAFAKKLSDAPLAIVDKRRQGHNLSEVMTSLVPDLLQGSCDAGHRCHLWLDPHAHLNPPPTFRLRTIKNRWRVYHIFEEHLQAYGLLAFSKLTSSQEKFMLDPSLLTALVDRWRPETHTFHLRSGELAPTLKDVSLITALPISGKPLVPAAYSSIWPHDVSVRLGVAMPESTRTGGRPRGVPLHWLIQNFHEFPADASHETMRRHLFAYLLYLFGMMFPSSHGGVVLPSLIKIAEQIVDDPLPPNPIYSFGSAMLAHTYRGLCDATKKTTTSSKGHILAVSYEFLQLWSWEYLPVGRPQILNKIHPYNSRQEEHGPLTMASRWTHVSKRWSTNVVRGCYPEYHQQFELLDELSITWNPWTDADFESVWGVQPVTPDCLRDSGLWMTRCNLLFVWMVEPYNPERVMRQFGLYQDVPPPLPRRVDDETHKQDNKGMNCFDWSAHNRLWIELWNNEAASDIVHEDRPYNHDRTGMYNQWYRSSTRTLLTGPPPPRPTQLTRDEQLLGGIERSSAYHRDSTIDELSQIAQDAQAAMRMRNMNCEDGRSTVRRIYETAMKGLRRFGCARDDDVVTRAYDMPEARSCRPSATRSSRPSAAGTSQPRRSEAGPTSFPRQDSSLLHRSQSGQGSQGHAATQEDNLFPLISPYGGRYSYTQGEGSQSYNTTQETIDPTWDEMGAGLGYSMARPQGREQMQRHDNTGTSHEPRNVVPEILEEFFGSNPMNTSASLIPPGSEPTAATQLSGSQHVFQTPSPRQETQTEDDEPQYGFGFRQPHPPPERWSPSGPRQRHVRPRRRD